MFQDLVRGQQALLAQSFRAAIFRTPELVQGCHKEFQRTQLQPLSNTASNASRT